MLNRTKFLHRPSLPLALALHRTSETDHDQPQSADCIFNGFSALVKFPEANFLPSVYVYLA
jgi:hypothetical protein